MSLMSRFMQKALEMMSEERREQAVAAQEESSDNAARSRAPESTVEANPPPTTAAPPVSKPMPPPVAKPVTPTTANAADPVAVAELCRQTGVDELCAGYIKRRLSLEEVEAALQTAKAVDGLVAQARQINGDIDPRLAHMLNREGVSEQGTREILAVIARATQDIEVSPIRDIEGGGGWDDAVAKANSGKA